MTHEAPPQVVLRPLGHPLPLGFLALMVGTLVLSSLQLGWVPDTDSRVVAFTALGFTAPLQLLASYLGFHARDTVAGTGMGILGATWAVVGIAVVTSPPGSTSEALGVLLLAAALALAVPASAAFGRLAAGAVLSVAVVRFGLTGVAQLTGSPAWADAAGVIGLVLALLALYAAVAFLWEDVRHRAVLPVLRHDQTGEPTASGLEEQVTHLQREPGVRTQL